MKSNNLKVNEKINVFNHVKLSIKIKMLAGIIIAILASSPIAVFINGLILNLTHITGNFSVYISTGINVLVVSLIIMVELNWFIIKPLQKVIVATEKLAAGDIDIDLNYKAKDEIGQLFLSFNKIILSLKELVAESDMLINETIKGNLDAQGSEQQLEGSYKEIIQGMNKLVRTLTHYIEILPNPSLIINKNMEIEYLNEASADIIGLTKQQIKGKKCYDLFKTSHCNTENCACVQSMKQEKLISSKTDAHPNGLNLDIEYSGTPIKDTDGAVIGAFEVIEDTTEIIKAQKEAKEQAEAVQEQMDIAKKQAKYQENEVKKLIVNLDKLSKGNLDISTSLEEADEDTQELAEIFETINNRLEISVDSIKSYIQEISDTLSSVADKDLTVDIQREYLGEFIKLKKAINYIISQFNVILSEINASAEQVGTGADQVAASSQNLSQGSSEQAGSVEEISASITQVSEQTKENAVNAKKANELSAKSKENAQNGNTQMERMLAAMNDIKESSQSISNIIKVIDEIAFQTNILALNAAVEAARAGEHGKGFAVVAEEVRNLAARSAKAAKETTELIDNSINKVEDGYKIANETAGALKQIVTGAADTVEIVGAIADASNEQANAISEINQGVEQISQVTQSNTATAEESASASEEMAGQAQMLKQLIQEFHLKNTNKKLEGNTLNNKKIQEPKENDKAGVKIALDDDSFGKY